MTYLAAVGPAPSLPPSLERASAALEPEQQLMALILASQNVLAADAQVSIAVSFDEIERMRAQIQEALEKAREAQKASGFWGGISKLFSGDLAALAELVAAASMVIATGGASLAVIAAVAAAVSLAAGHAEELGIPPGVAAGIGIAAGLCLVATGDLTSLASSATKLARTATTVAEAARFTAYAAQGTGAALGAVSKHFAAAAIRDRAETVTLEARSDVEHSSIEEALELFSSSVETACASFRLTSTIVAEAAQSRVRLIQSWGGLA